MKLFIGYILPEQHYQFLDVLRDAARENLSEGYSSLVHCQKEYTFHSTLLYLGDVQPEEKPNLNDAIARVAQRHAPVKVRLDKVCLLSNQKDNAVVVATSPEFNQALYDLLADLQKENVNIIAAVKTADDAKVAMETLEIGTDGVIFEPNDFAQIKDMANLIDELSTESYELKDLTITNVEPVGSGDRVCIDTTTMMKPGEGMLIGSYSKAMFFIHSESLESEYVASRPFRVNAGPVQAYVMVPGNKTRYLSELETGDEVLIVDKDGKTKKSIVGRSKIEKRPLLLIEAEYEDMKIRSLVQNAETIRLVDENDEPISVSVLEPGMKVKGFIDDSARHFGMAIDEQIIEQ